jgi:hypothetical protein
MFIILLRVELHWAFYFGGMNRKEYLKKYYQDNKEKYNAQSKSFYQNNRDRCLMLNEEWRITNKEYIKSYKREWYKRKKEKEQTYKLLEVLERFR